MIQSITIIGKRWLDKPNGNVYFSAVGLINGKEVVHIPFEGGHNEVYIQEITSLMVKRNLLPDYEFYQNGGKEEIWRYCKRKNIAYYKSVADVKSRKDL